MKINNFFLIKQYIVFGLIFISCFYASLCFGGNVAEPQLIDNREKVVTKEYRARLLGDKAFKDGLYHLSLKFYEQYYKQAKKNNDTTSVIDAAECLIASNVNSGNSIAARNVFNELTSTYAASISEDKPIRNSLTFWEGNIQMTAGYFKKAIKTFSSLLNKLPQNSKLFLKTLDAKGTAQARDMKWADAEKTYAVMEFAAPSNSKWKLIALKKRVLALLMSGDYAQAEKLIHKIPDQNKTYSGINTILLYIRKGNLDKAFTAYKSIRKYARGADVLWFLMADTLANEFLKSKTYRKALFVLSDAVLYANSEYDRQLILLRIINTAVLAGQIDAAVTTAEKFLKNYPDSFISNEIRLRLANLYSDEKKSEDALQIYETVINDQNSDLKQKIESARAAAKIFILMKDFSSAKEKFEYIAHNASDTKIQGEGMFWIAELLYIQEKYLDAAEAFKEVAEKFDYWRDQALFKEIKSLMNSLAFSKALKVIDTFSKNFTKSTFIPEVIFLKALALKSIKKYSEACTLFEKFADSYPNHEYAPRALFEAATIILEHKKTEDAVIAYTKLIKKYPKDKLLPNALYRRMNACFWCGFSRKGADDAETLLDLYPKSKFAVYAGYALVDYHIRSARYEHAISVLKKMLNLYKSDNNLSASIMYDIADTRFKQGELTMALNVLDELSEKYSDTNVAGEALLLRGDILLSKGDYEQSVPFFIKASKARPDSILAISALGRLGDVYLAIGSKTPDGINYMKAISYYKKVLESAKLTPRFRDQALYKLGRCEELVGNKGEAIPKFREAVYNYELDVESGRSDAVASIWFVKSALAAARLYLEKDTPEAAEAAIAIYTTLIKVGVEPIKDFKQKISEIRTKYKLKE